MSFVRLPTWLVPAEEVDRLRKASAKKRAALERQKRAELFDELWAARLRERCKPLDYSELGVIE